jgi:hypothetical protein
MTQPIVINKQNDFNKVLFGDSEDLIKTNVIASMLDLGRFATNLSYSHIDRTDLVGDHGYIDKVVVGVTFFCEDKFITEYFKCGLGDTASSTFMPVESSGHLKMQGMGNTFSFLIFKHTLQWDGGPSKLTTMIDKDHFKVTTSFMSLLQPQLGTIQTIGQSVIEHIDKDNPIDNKPPNLIVAELAAYRVKLNYDSE